MKDEMADRIEKLSPLKRALLHIDELEEKLRAAEGTTAEPIAIVGLGCRFPAADHPDAFWRLLSEGGFAGGEPPADRFRLEDWYDPDPTAPGKINMRVAGYLTDIASFDAAFFGIAPREAVSMDPQQRLLLEVVWEALEHAAIAPASLAGTATGVYVGLYNDNYTMAGRGSGDPAIIDGWSAAGAHTSIAAGRVSYLLGVHGPSLAIDTACSSSLVAVHLACQALRARECDTALAGGVHLIVSPRSLVAATKLGVTAPDGRCKAFDSAADGFGHGEGCGIVVLKRLADARAEGLRILAVVRGSAVNQDGRSSGLTAPSGPAQAEVIRTALARSGVAPALVGYVEAHGTGTRLGDPIEIQALHEALGAGRDASAPLHIGSVKTNIGHLEAAAGVAGLIKTVLALHHREIPAHLHFHSPNPEIALTDIPAVVPTQSIAWPALHGRRIAGVSSFGFSGTNAHLIVEEAESDPVRAEVVQRPAHILCLSARTEAALTALVARHAEQIDGSLGDWSYSANAGRSHHAVRLAVVATATSDARDRLVAAGTPASRAGLFTGTTDTRTPRVAFLFTGQGSQYAGMAHALYRTEPLFRDVIDRCAAAVSTQLPRPLCDVMFGDDAASLTDTRFAQPALFALEVALAELWRSWGIEPEAVLGHSIGEYAAVCVAGGMSIEDGMRLVTTRGRLMGDLAAGGGMAAVFAGEDRVRALIQGHTLLSVAAVNGPRNTVISGDLAQLNDVLRALAGEGIEARRLDVSHAFHSPLMDSVLGDLESAAAACTQTPTRIPVASNATGRSERSFDARYWREHARGAVRFADGMRELARLGCDVYLEIGPQPVLIGMGRVVIGQGAFVASMRRDAASPEGQWRTLYEGLAELYVRGADVRWDAVSRGTAPRRVALPTYPFERRRYWLEEPAVAWMPSPASRATDVAAPAVAREADLGDARVFDFYDALSVVSRNYDYQPGREEEGHLAFGLLPEVVPGFSWLMALFDGRSLPDAYALLVSSQRELKDFLFAGVDFDRVRRVLDFGCGHAADLCSLAERHATLTCEGFTVSAGQVEVGRRRIDALGLGQRVRVQRADSARVPFPGQFDLIFGFEVSGLIADKEGLFRNIHDHLGDGGLCVIADFVACDDAIASPDTASYTSTADQWSDLLARHKLRLHACVDASIEVANFLHDPVFGRNVDDVVERFGLNELSRRHLLSNENIGKACRMSVMRYVLLTAHKDVYSRVEDIRAENDARLASPVPYARARRSGLAATAPWHEWLYGVTWREAGSPAPAAAPLPSPASLASALGPAIDAHRAELAPIDALGPELDALCGLYIQEALCQLGVADVDAAGAASVAPRYRRLLARFTDVLREDGVSRLRDDAHADARCAALMARFPAAAGELAMVRRCGAELAAVLAGARDPLSILFPGGSTEDAEAIYERSPFARAINGLLAEAVVNAARALPAGAPLRILEVGGGTGGSTATVLPRLAALGRPVSYVFTDVSPGFVARGRRRYAADACVSCRTLDISADPVAQGLPAGGFDLVIAANVLHATPDLSRTLGHVRTLLAPGGLLLAVENTGRLRWADLTFGLTDGMWNFTDTDVRRYALLFSAEWRAVLAAAGYEEPATVAIGEPDRGSVSQQALLMARAPAVRRRFSVVADSGGVAEALAASLGARGDTSTFLPDGAALPEGPSDGVIYLGALDTTGPDDHDAGLQRALVLAQALARRGQPAPLWLVTRGATDDGPSASGAAQAPLWGFGRAVQVEEPGLACHVFDLDPAATIEAQVASLVSELDARDRELQVARRGTRRLVPRLTRMTTTAAPPSLREEATYLVTGGLGGLGIEVARWLFARGARHLVLMGRHAPSAAARTATDAMVRDGAHIQIVEADVANAADLARVLAVIAGGMPPLRGVIHAAGVVDDAVLSHQSWDKFRTVMAAKIHGSWNLHQQTQALDLDLFVLFSSAASLLGSAGQCNHAAANAFLPALARMRRAADLPAQAIDWGAWGEVGAAARPVVSDEIGRRGLRPMAPAQAIAALDAMVRANSPHLAIVDVDWDAYLRHLKGAAPPFLSEVSAGAAPLPGVERHVPESSLVRSLEQTPVEGRQAVLLERVRAFAAKAMALAPDDAPAADRPLRDLGLDSLMAVEMRNDLATAVGANLPATLLFDRPTCDAIATYLADTALARFFPASVGADDDADPMSGLSDAEIEARLAQELAAASALIDRKPTA